MHTPFSSSPTPRSPRTTEPVVHPRPDRRRERWQDLAGTWEFSFDEASFDRSITVPFAPEAAVNGFEDVAEVLWYRRRLPVPPLSSDERLLVHFGAVDHAATVWVDGTQVASHAGGHTSFSCEVTHALDPARPDHELVVRAIDSRTAPQLRGKQSPTFPLFIHYTATSGIWGPVWSEVTGASWIDSYRLDARADGALRVNVEVAGAAYDSIRVTVGSGTSACAFVGSATPESPIVGVVDHARPWSPDDPHLEPLRIDVLDAAGAVLDTVSGHVGFRTLTIEPGRWLLNGRPFRQRLLLDQGYWPDTLMTPPSEQALIDDLRFVLDAGFDGVRKHQKIEDPRFLWHADRLGLFVWEELPSPFVGVRIQGELEAAAVAEWTEAIVRDASHPSVIAWVPINESWGVHDVHDVRAEQEVVRRLAAVTRSLDATRPVVDNSGWGHVDTDVVDVHDYDQDPAGLIARWSGIEARGWGRGSEGELVPPDIDLDQLRRFVGVPDDGDWGFLRELLPNMAVWAPGCIPSVGTAGPLIVSEFGGVGFSRETDRGTFDYARAADADDLLARFEAQCAALESVPEIQGWCWTELADVQQEINGLLFADRSPKVSAERLRAAIDRLPWSRPGEKA